MAAVAGGRVSGHAALGRRAHVASRGGMGTTKSRRAHPVFECRATAEAEKTASLAKVRDLSGARAREVGGAERSLRGGGVRAARPSSTSFSLFFLPYCFPGPRLLTLSTFLLDDLFVPQYQTVGDRFLVTLFEREAKTDGGILLSAKAAENQAAGEKLLIGTVHAVPEDTELKVKAGDKILFAKYGATETRLDGADVYFVRSGEVLAVLE